MKSGGKAVQVASVFYQERYLYALALAYHLPCPIVQREYGTEYLYLIMVVPFAARGKSAKCAKHHNDAQYECDISFCFFHNYVFPLHAEHFPNSTLSWSDTETPSVLLTASKRA